MNSFKQSGGPVQSRGGASLRWVQETEAHHLAISKDSNRSRVLVYFQKILIHNISPQIQDNSFLLAKDITEYVFQK